MITNITLENFKCFRHVSINPKRLTVLIGPNGTGKSSILQALLLLKQSVGQSRVQFHGELVNFSRSLDSGSTPNFLPDERISKIILSGNSRGDSGDISYQYGAKFSPFSNVVSNFGEIRSELENNIVELVVNECDESLRATIKVGKASAELVRSREVGQITDQQPVSSWSGSPVPRQDIRDEAVALPSIVSTVLLDIKAVPSVRGLVRPRYELADRLSTDVTLSGGLSAQEEQTASNLGYSRPLENKVSDLLQKVTGTGLRAETVPPRAVEVNSLAPSGPVNIVAEGFGANALILLLQQLISADKYATVLIEEPEIHLHPKAQAELAEVLAETAKAEDKQIIMTTHSEHIAGRLLTLVAEKLLSTDDLAIYSFEKDEKGECYASEIEITELGQTSGGLTGFFDTNVAEMDRYVKALQNRS